MSLDRRPPCAFPPHPAGPGWHGSEPGEGELVPASAVRRFTRWLRHAPAERLPLPAVPAVWTAAEVLHMVHVPGLYPGAAALAAAGIAYGAGERRARRSEHPRLAGAEVAAVTGAAGAWLTAAGVVGPLAGPDHVLSIGYVLSAGGGYWWLRRHSAVKAARERRAAAARWRARKSAWHQLAPRLGLTGSHLLDYGETLLGESMLIDTRGTGKRASQISGRDVAERYGEIELIPAGRIDVAPDRIPGRLRITIRRQDPWAQPLTHPAADPASPFAPHVPEVATCHKPVVIGADPETGTPLPLPLWDADEGGKVILIAAKKGSGKTVLMTDIRERVTACTDAILIQVNLSMVRHDRRWAPLAEANALGRTAQGTAREVLQFVVDVIFGRSEDEGRDRLTVPSPQQPLFVVSVDEVDQVAADPVCQQLLKTIASKCRNEAVTLILAGQRATAQWMGGADLRANVDIAVLGRFARRAEARKATGEDIDLPDMGEYGEGHPGVFLVTELGGGGSWHRGRVFNLDQPADIDRIVARRANSRQPYRLEAALRNLSAKWAKITSGMPDGDTGDTGDRDGRPVGPAAPGVGQIVPDAGAITAKIGHARDLAAGTPAIPPIPPGMEEHAAYVLAERQRQALQNNFGDVAIPSQVAPALLSLLAGPGGTTAGQAAEAIGKSKPAAHRYLSALRVSGIARLDGSGRGARYRLAEDTFQRAPLTVLTGGGSHDGGEDCAAEAEHRQ